MRVGTLLNRAQTEHIQESRAALKQLEQLILEGETAEIFKEFCECTSLIIGCKKGELPRSLLAFMNELMKALKHVKAGRNFIHNLIKYLVKGVDSKLKHVRHNSLSLLWSCMEHLDSVSPRLWEIVKIKIGEKLFDKEVNVRVLAVRISAKYQEASVEGGLHFYKLFKDLLRYDTSADVRKLVLQYIVVNKSTVSAIATRAADTSDAVRMVFATNKLALIPWDGCLSLDQRALLLQTLEEERVEEIRKKSLERFEIIFEEVFEGKYEMFTDAFYVENGNNNSLKNVLKELMKRHEYASGFDEGFLERATPALLFLMWVSLEHVDSDRGRDNLVLPDMAVLLKSIADSSCSVGEDGEYSGTLSHALFSLLDYYDIFQSSERGLLVKCALYILSQGEHLLPGVVDSVCKMVIKACSGSESPKVYLKALGTGEARTQMLFSKALLMSKEFDPKAFLEVFEVIERKCEEAIFSPDEEIKECGVHLLVLCASETGKCDEAVGKLLELVRQGWQSAFRALVDLSIVFRTRKDVFDTVFGLVKTLQFEMRDKSITKLLLSDLASEEQAEELVRDLVERFYSEETGLQDAQYLHVFFYEYFRTKHWVVFTIYRDVISKIKHWKVFNDQIIYWFESRKDLAYKESDLLLIVLSVSLKALKGAKEAPARDRKELLQKHLDLLSKVAALRCALTEEEKAKALELASALSKQSVKILPDSDVVKNILFDLISRE
ncbi:uncharacterized protein NEMAJ01_0551 [Nematocida major]|uniref:uncharacterized protein n=1 Tax=Nematocida major TaxID=1912982 RepID=UPI002007BBF8|nr:uncharacterized protein NEMAJ01_0551 [Nematocida major]KAH9385655.1 hypothetical protein NEMAJ01_0551 [Nematocida major]